MNRPLIAAAAALAAGIITSDAFKIPFYAWLIGAAACGGASFFLTNKKAFAAVLCAFFFAGAASYSRAIIWVPKNSIASPDFSSAQVNSVTGRIRDIPKESENTAYFVIDVREASGGGVKHTGLSGRARVSMRLNLGLALKSGDIVEIRSKLLEPDAPQNPGQFDYRKYLYRKGISRIIRCNDANVIIKGREPGFFTLAGRIRQSMVRAVYAYVPPEEAVVLEGVMTGNERKIPDDLNDAFRATGTAHILAVSGMNAGLVTLFIFLLLKAAGIRGPPAAWITMAGVALFCLVTGAEGSIVRASVMACSALLALALGRQADVLNALYISCFGMALIEPAVVFDAGFQLSFFATFGLIYMTPWLMKLCRGWPEAVAITAGGTVAAQLFVSPLIINIFGQFSLVSPAANIFIAPLSGFATITGFVMWIFSWFPEAAKIFGASSWLIIKTMSYLAQLMAGLPHAAISVKPAGVLLTGAYYFFLLALPHADTDVRVMKVSLKTAGGFVLTAALLCHVLCHDGRFGFYEFRAKNMTASFYKTAKNEKILVLACDGGKKQADISYAVIPYLRRRGVNVIDLLVCVEMKNSENIAEISGNFDVKKVMYSGNFTKCYSEKWGYACAGKGFGELDFNREGKFITRAWPGKAEEGARVFVCGRQLF